MVVDDSVLYRKTLSDILGSFPGVEVVRVASNGKIALARIPDSRPHLVTLDVEMPVMNGLETLERLRADHPDVQVVMVSAVTGTGAAVSLQALERGAFDVVAKTGTSEDLGRRLRSIVDALQLKLCLANARGSGGARTRPAPPKPAPTPAPLPPARTGAQTRRRPCHCVAIGISTGGPNALIEMLPRLPGNLRVPIVIVQHMPELFTRQLAESLNRKSALRVSEAVDGDRLERGHVYIAPGGRQLRLEKDPVSRTVKVALTNDPPEHHCRPAADYLFRSVAEVYGASALSVVMTGMGRDGVAGATHIRDAGGAVFAQGEESSTVFGMPAEAIRAGIVDQVLELDQLADGIQQHVCGGSI